MSNNNENSPPTEGNIRPRRNSVTSQTFTNLFARSNSIAGGPTAPFPGTIASAANQDQRRRMSITTLGLSGTSPTQNASFTFGGRRGSVSTAGSDSIDENAIDDEEGPARSTPTTPFVRRMSFGAQALRTVRTGGSPGTAGRPPVYSSAQEPNLPSIPSGPRSSRAGSVPQGAGLNSIDNTPSQASITSKPRTLSNLASVRPGEGGFNWSDQLRSRAESSVSQNQRPSFPISPITSKPVPAHDRTKSVEMAAPPTVVPAPAPAPSRKPAPRKPDAMQERILKGEFYMD